MNNPKLPVRDFVAVDLETTGLNPKRDKIIEIGAVRVRGGQAVGFFQQLINPGRNLSNAVKEITGLTDQNLEKAPSIHEVIPAFLDFAGDDYLLGHHVIFDFSFLKKAAINEGLVFEKEAIDTLTIARKYLPELESRRLVNLCQYFKIKHEAHRALHDAQAAAELYERLLEKFYSFDYEGEKKKNVFLPAKLIYQVKKEGPITPSQKVQLLRMLKYHAIDSEYDVDLLTRNEASRYLDHLILRFGRFPKVY